MKRYILSFSLLVLSLTLGYGQERTAYENTVTENFAFRYQQNVTGVNQSIVNSFLETLSNGRNASGAEYILVLPEYSRIIRNGKVASLRFKIMEPKMQGDVFYRKYNFGSMLCPSFLSGNLEVSKSGKLLTVIPLGNYSLRMGVNQAKDVNFTDSLPGDNYSITLRNPVFIYSDEAKKLLRSSAGFVDEYYRAPGVLKNILNDLNKINPEDYEHLAYQNKALESQENALSAIQDRKFLASLGEDFAGFAPAFRQAAERATYLRNAMDATCANLHIIYYNKGVEALDQDREDDALNYFSKSLNADYYFSPTHYQLARLFFYRGHLDEAGAELRFIYEKTRPSVVLQPHLVSLAGSIYYSYISSGDASLSGQRYDEAIGWYQKAKSFCGQPYTVACTSQPDTGIAHAEYAIYASMLNVAANTANKGNLDEALIMAVNARNYALGHPLGIHSTQWADELIFHLKGGIYARCIKTGAEYLNAKQFNPAFSQFRQAFKIEHEYTIQRDQNLPGYLRSSGKPVLLAGIDKARNNITDLDFAKNTVTETDQLANQYYMAEDQQIKTELTDLRGRIFKQICINLQNAYNEVLTNAKNAEQGGDYIRAMDLYRGASAKKTEESACGLNTFEADEKIKAIAPAAQFQQDKITFDRYAANLNYREAILKYVEMGKDYNTNNLSRFNLKYQPLYEFAAAHTNRQMGCAAASWYYSNKDYNHCLGLLRTALDRGVSRKCTKDLQKKLGLAMATQDFSRDKDAGARISEYGASGKKLKFFRKAYLKAWKGRR